jgi:DNA-binding beta-propeller fold protein YncE
MRFTLWLLLLAFSSETFSQIVTTLVADPTTRFRDDIILDTDGNLYCSDYSGSDIYKLTPGGDVSVFATGLNTPNGLAFDSNQDLFVCDNIGNRIYKLDLSGSFLDTFEVSKPSGIIKEFDSDTMIFTEYGSAHTLSKLAPDGTITETHSGDPLNGPVGLVYDGENQLYVANFNNREIYKVFDDSLQYWATVPGPGSGTLGFITFGGGYLWGTSWNAHQIYGISVQTIDSTFLYTGSTLGGTDGLLSDATFAGPNGIHSNFAGDTIYISEYNSGRLRMISPGVAGEEQKLVKELNFQLYPNPSKGEINVVFETVQKVNEVILLDAKGQVISKRTKESFKGTNSFSWSVDKAGIYFVRLRDEEGNISQQKLIVQ